MGEHKLYKADKTSLAVIDDARLTRQGFTVDRAEMHLRSHLTSDEDEVWCNQGCLAKAIWGQSTAALRREITQRFPYLVNQLWDRKLVLLPYRVERGRIAKFKLYEGKTASTEESAAFRAMKDRALHDKERTAEDFDLLEDLASQIVPSEPDSVA